MSAAARVFNYCGQRLYYDRRTFKLEGTPSASACIVRNLLPAPHQPRHYSPKPHVSVNTNKRRVGKIREAPRMLDPNRSSQLSRTILPILVRVGTEEAPPIPGGPTRLGCANSRFIPVRALSCITAAYTPSSPSLDVSNHILTQLATALSFFCLISCQQPGEFQHDFYLHV